MPLTSPMELLDWLAHTQLLAPAQVDGLRPIMPGFADCHAFARELIRCDMLTPYQVNQILQGRRDGLILGDYRLRERLGEGAMGQVFKAWNLRLQRIVAVKTIHKELVNSGKAMERFRREMQTASRLDHPNIALVRDADEVAGSLYLVMDYIDGFNLSHRVKQQGPLRIEEAAEYARQAALGLQHALERGIVHRDIKPGNLLVATTKENGESLPTVKILDFGLARYESERDKSARLTQVGNILGTIDYIAPEQVQNASTADIRADIYSLGCSLYYLLAGEPPFPGNNVMEKIGPRLTGEPPSVRRVRAEVPPGLDDVLRKMMARHPNDRFQTPIEAAVALLPFTGREPPSLPPAQPVEHPGPAHVFLAQPVAPGAESAGTIAMAHPVLAMPIAVLPQDAPAAPPNFFDTLADARAIEESLTAEAPTFQQMSASGRDLSSPATAAVPAGTKDTKPLFARRVVWIAGGGFALALVIGVCALSASFLRDAKKRSNGEIRITEAKFSMPSKQVKPGDTKFVLVLIQRIAFKGPVKVSLKDLPDGVTAESKSLPDRSDRCDIRFTVSHGTAPILKPIRVVAECEAEGISAEKALELKIIEDPMKN